MTLSQEQPIEIGVNGLALIKKFEGCKLKAYQDSVGVWTIGYGNTYYENMVNVKKGDIITQARAEQLFPLIVSKFASGVRKRVKSTINQNQFDALVSFTYNVGFGNFDKSTLLKKVNASPYDDSITSEFMKWNKAGGKVLKGLTARRKAEAHLYFS